MAGVEPISGAAPSRRILTAGPSPARASCNAGAFDLEDERGNVCGEAKGLKVPVAQAASGIECRFEHTARRRTRHFERDRLDTSVGSRTARPPAVPVAQLDRANRQRPSDCFFEEAAHQRGVVTVAEDTGQRAQQFAECGSSIALPWKERRRHCWFGR